MHKDAITKPTEAAVYKFVKVNDEYRFIESTMFSGNHKDLVDDGEIATAAGTIFVVDDGENKFWRIEDYYSTTLKVACKGGEQKEIQAIVGLPYYDRWG